MGNVRKTLLSIDFKVFLATIIMAAMLNACSAIDPPLGAGSQIQLTATSNTHLPTPAASGDAESLSSNPTATMTLALIPLGTSSPLLETPPPSDVVQPDEGQNLIDFGPADLAIIRPGQLSRHNSPIRIIANLNTTLPMETKITLYGEDGREIFSKLLWSKPYNDPINGNLITDLEFSIPGLSEIGRLEIKAFEPSGRIWALNSVYQILLSRGITDRNYAPENQDRILLQLPFPDQREISDSPIFISGIVRTSSDSPLDVWLVDEAGTVVGEGQASVVLTPGSDYGQFVGEIPYQVSGPTQVFMTIGMEEGRIPGLTYLKTIDFSLLPDDN